MAYDVRLATQITTAVDRRLRMLALVKRQPLSHVLVSLLDQALPPADELASLLGDGIQDLPTRGMPEAGDADATAVLECRLTAAQVFGGAG